MQQRRRARLREQVVEVVAERVRERLWRDAATNEWLESRLASLVDGDATPFSVANELLQRSGALLTGVRS